MSTKIYNAFITRTSVLHVYDLAELNRKLQRMFKPVSRRQFYKAVGWVVANHIDEEVMLGKRRTQATEAVRAVDLEVREQARKGYCTEPFDREVTWTFFPREDGRVQLIVYAGERAIIKKLECSPDWLDYHYQNQTDEPEDVTPFDWKQREKDWDKYMPTGVPSVDGLGGQLWGKYGDGPRFHDTDQIVRHLPSLKQRIERVTVRVLERNFYARQKLAKPTGQVIEQMDSFHNFRKSGRGVLAYHKIRARAVQTLFTITHAHLFEGGKPEKPVKKEQS